LRRTHETLEEGVGNIKKREILDEKKKLHIWERGGRILRIHSRKETSEDESEKSRNSKQVVSVTKSERG
jgi:hypothetical protein